VTDSLEEQDALRRELAQFIGSETFYRHWSGRFIYTEGTKYLAEKARVWWLIDLIASLQPRALQDAALCEFQLWELRVNRDGAVAACLRDSDDEAFRQTLRTADSALDYVRLYLEGGVLMLPTEH
jgi:hypothetical protein